MAPNTPRAGQRLPAPPSARALETLRDDPMEPAAIEHHEALPPPPPPPPLLPDIEAEGLYDEWVPGVAFACLLGLAVMKAADGEIGAAAIMALCGGLMVVLAKKSREMRDRIAPPEDPPDALSPSSPSGRPVRALGPAHTADQLVIELKRPEGPPGVGFDPSDPTHRQMADLIHTCRTRDGLGFAGPPIADEPGALVASIGPFGGSAATLEERLDEWARIARFVEAYGNPRAVWLAAVACREEASVRRGAAALTQLAALPDQQAQLDRVAASVEADGHWCARSAVALHRGDAEALTRLIAEAPSAQTSSLGWLIEAIWAVEPDPARLDAWAARVHPAMALVQAELPGAGEARWRALLSHAVPIVAGQAVEVMLSEQAPLPLLGARALLTRPDVQRFFADRSPSRVLQTVAGDCMDLIAREGVVDDLLLLGMWGSDRWMGDQARRSHRALKARVGADVRGEAGGLALAVVPEASGGLSPADGRGGLSPAEPEAG